MLKSRPPVCRLSVGKVASLRDAHRVSSPTTALRFACTVLSALRALSLIRGFSAATRMIMKLNVTKFQPTNWQAVIYRHLMAPFS